MGKRNSQKQINRAYHSRIKQMLKGETEREIFAALSAGKNTYLRYDRLQSSSFDSSWIEMIEGVIFDLGEIIANPKMNTKVVGNIVPVELARKTGAESVQHLSSHTQYIKEIDEYGNVIPSKIMTMMNEDDLHTYENRFIATLVRRLVLFIEKRYEVVSEFAELRNEEVLMFKNKSIVNGAEVEIETKIKVSYKADDENAIKSTDYIKRIAELRNYILYFYNSSFMRQLKTERDVRNPILQTNIIRKNPKYHHCYEVYRFIETYDRLGVNYKIDENYALFNPEELDELNHTLFANYVTLRGKDLTKNRKEITHIYKPRILTSLDDEAFIYGDLLRGPISFVRTDEKYQEYLDSKIKKNLPLHPTKKEKEYYADEYAEKAENKEDKQQKENLLKRRNKEIKQFEKQVEKILVEREAARLALEAQEREIIRNEENALLTAARNSIINASLTDQEDATKDFLEKEEQHRIDQIKANVASTKVTPMSHPFTEPVTYEEAVEQIWPQTKNAPTLRVEPAIEEAPTAEEVEEQAIPASEEVEPQEAPIVNKEKAQPQVVPMSHPYSEPVTYDEAVEQIWPQTKNAPALRVVPKEEETAANKEAPKAKETAPAVKEQPREEVKEEQPQSVEAPAKKPPVIQQGMSFDDAALEVWPQLKGVSGKPITKEENKPVEAKPKAKKAKVVPTEENKETAPVNKPVEPVVTPMSHPYSEPVTYEEAVEEIWPQTKGAPVLRVAPKEEEATPVSKKAPAKKATSAKKVSEPKQETAEPVIKPVEMSHPYSEPVTYEEAVEEIWPQTKNAPALRKVPEEEKVTPAPNKSAPKKAQKAKPVKAEAKEEAQPVEEPAKEQKAEQKKAPTKKAAPKATPKEQKIEEQVAPVVEEAPVEEILVEVPVEEIPSKEAQQVEEPQAAETAPIEEAPKAEPKAKKPAAKSAPKKAEPQEQKKATPKVVYKPVAKKEEPRRAKIPGRFIVKTNNGYYVNKNKFSVYKDDAKVFDDFNLAHDIKKALGCKVVKL